jgi:hypothetical protein
MSAHCPRLAADAIELAELLGFLSDWLDGHDAELLADSFQRFVGARGYDLNDLRIDLAWFTFLLGNDDGAALFGGPDE